MSKHFKSFDLEEKFKLFLPSTALDWMESIARNKTINNNREFLLLANVIEKGDDSETAWLCAQKFPKLADKMFNCILNNYIRTGEKISTVALVIYDPFSRVNDSLVNKLKMEVLLRGDYANLESYFSMGRSPRAQMFAEKFYSTLPLEHHLEVVL